MKKMQNFDTLTSDNLYNNYMFKDMIYVYLLFEQVIKQLFSFIARNMISFSLLYPNHSHYTKINVSRRYNICTLD